MIPATALLFVRAMISTRCPIHKGEYEGDTPIQDLLVSKQRISAPGQPDATCLDYAYYPSHKHMEFQPAPLGSTETFSSLARSCTSAAKPLPRHRAHWQSPSREPAMLFLQSAGVFFLGFILSRFLLLQRPPTTAETLLCCLAIAVLWLLRLLVQRASSESVARGGDIHQLGTGE